MDELKERLAQALIEVRAVEFGTFTLASGRQSDVYVNIKRAITRPEVLALCAEGMAFHAMATPGTPPCRSIAHRASSSSGSKQPSGTSLGSPVSRSRAPGSTMIVRPSLFSLWNRFSGSPSLEMNQSKSTDGL